MLPVPSGGVLVASPSTALREQVRRSLHSGSCAVQEVRGGADALAKLESGQWQFLFLDRRLPDLDAEELIQIIKARFPGIEVVILDSDAEPGQQLPAVGNARFHSWLQPAEQTAPRHQADAEKSPNLTEMREANAAVAPLPGMIGNAEKMQRLYRLARLVAPRNTTVLILGATGTGKELVARAIHALSPRSSAPWVVVNCAAIPETLLESELFGYARGAFTGAVQSYAGRIHSAQGGTLFLDEIGDLPLNLQAKLLRFLEQKEVQRLGSTESVRIDVRVVAATNVALARRVEQGRFREDLYYRLSAFPLELPPLAERREDIALLAEHFLQANAVSSRCKPPVLAPATCQLLEAQAWRGNVRELQQVMERAAILIEGGGRVLPEHLYFSAAVRALPSEEKSAEPTPC